MYRIFFIHFFLFIFKVSDGQLPFEINSVNTVYNATKTQIKYLEDKKGKYAIDDAKRLAFLPVSTDVPNFFITHATFWLRFSIKNNTNDKHLLINVNHATLDDVVFYYPGNSPTVYDSVSIREDESFNKRNYKNQTHIFGAFVNKGEEKIFYLKVRASEQLLVPISVGSEKLVLEDIASKDLIFGLYIGIMLVMAAYNLFLFFSTKESSYFYYVGYIIFVGLTQSTLQGYSFRFLWPQHAWFNNYAAIIIPFFNGIAAIEFVKNFLALKTLSPKMNKGLTIVEILYCVSLILCFTGELQEAQIVIQFVAFLGSFLVLAFCIILSYRKHRVAKILLIAWTFFLCSVIIFVLRNFGFLPYNSFTYYALQIGSSIEAILLSLALADKINTYRKEEAIARHDTLVALTENERLVKEQNSMLEQEVQHRTEQLINTNEELKDAMHEIKRTQAKLLATEKMASLGQLTAGIAHEINNPINFVTSNIRPLESNVHDLTTIINMYEGLDITNNLSAQVNTIENFKKEIDLPYVKEEIDILLSGIKEGAERTSEIVKGLRNFARVDEANWKRVDINEGLDSTLLLVKNTYPPSMKLVKELGPIPKIECAPGKINQVFMNIITNAIQAIKSNNQRKEPGVLEIKTWENEGFVLISIGDNGPGMTEAIKNKIFEPFFTTKDVGEGTGLGLSIVQGIIEDHKGEIVVESEPGTGTSITIKLPVR